jgi:CubicO group peptidase (beta-lactamase class C family)
MSLHVDGSVDPAFEVVREVFADTLPRGAETGSAVAVELDGRWVVDLWGGRATADGTAWQRDSIVQPYSVSKPFTAVCALLLADAGELQLNAPVQRYWPEFRADATVRSVLDHSAGVVALPKPAPAETFYDWRRMCALLAAADPAWPPGTAHGESALFYGHLIGEIVRRISGQSLGTVLRERVCGALGLDFAFGLTPAEERRAVQLTGLDDRFRAGFTLGRPELYARAVGNPPGAWDPRVVNSSAWRRAEIPAINGHGTARAVAGLYAALRDGRLLSPGLLRDMTEPRPATQDLVFGDDKAWGLGVIVEDEGFGMGGTGGSFGWTSRDGYAIGFVTGAMADHSRGERVENALRSCLWLPAL